MKNWLFFLVPAGVVLAAYLGISLYFTNHFYFGSVINGSDYTGKTADQVEALMAADIKEYCLEIAERGGKVEEIKAEEFGLSYVADGKIQALLDSQNQFLWPNALLKKETYEMSATITFGKAELKELVNDLECYDPVMITLPKDAHYEYVDGSYQIVPEEEGNQPKEGAVYDLVLAAVEKGDTRIDLEEQAVYERPAVFAEDEDLNAVVKTLNRYMGITVTYDFIDRTEEVTGEQIKDWLVVDGTEVDFDEKAVREYINSLSRAYNTFGDTRKFTTWDGSKVTVKGGDYGWLISRSVETAELIRVIKEGKSVKKEPIYLQSAYSRKKNDIGNTYVEINLAAQHMWFFKDGECLVDTDIVSGNTSKKYGTPTGSYQITYKERNATLTGEDYNTPVSYWMPFNYNIGIHDAAWRKSFGGELYKTTGSHGCINTPYNNAKIIYENIEAGVPVIVYKKKLDAEVLKELRSKKP